MRSEDNAVESICRVLREQGCQIAARTYRAWASTRRPVAAPTVDDAAVNDQVRDLARRTDHQGVRRMTLEAWNVAASKAVELVDAPGRMAPGQRGREGHPVVRGGLIGHADAGSQYISVVFTDHLADEGIRPSISSIGDASTTP